MDPMSEGKGAAIAGDRRRCSALTKSGAYCRGQALAGRDVCAVHSVEAVEGRRQGGQNRSNARRSLKVAPADMRQIAELISVAIRQVHDGQLEPARLSAMSSGTAALCKVLELVLLRSEVDALRDQVAELAAQRLVEGKPGGGSRNE